jgi:2-polyprenyl-3-methyl-5-hydroxy-6-metoxy-1,4-benzoquinol methylase
MSVQGAVGCLSGRGWYIRPARVVFLDGGGTSVQQASVLDVGAGSGHITECFAPLFKRVFATEISRMLVWRLEQRGFTAALQPATGPPTSATFEAAEGFDGRELFGTVVALNVLDRVPNSREFLKPGLVPLMAPGGRLVIALPLPYHAKRWVPDGARGGDGGDWAAQHALVTSSACPGDKLSMPW